MEVPPQFALVRRASMELQNDDTGMRKDVADRLAD